MQVEPAAIQIDNNINNNDNNNNNVVDTPSPENKTNNVFEGVDRILRGEQEPYDPTVPVKDNPILEHMRLEAITRVPENLAATTSTAADMGARDTKHVEADVDPENAPKYLRGDAVPRVAGQEYVVIRHPAEDNSGMIAIIGAFPTEEAATRHARLVAKCTKGEPFDYIVGNMYALMPWPPTLENIEAAESPNPSYQEILNGFIKRRNEANNAFKERARSDGIKV